MLDPQPVIEPPLVHHKCHQCGSDEHLIAYCPDRGKGGKGTYHSTVSPTTELKILQNKIRTSHR